MLTKGLLTLMFFFLWRVVGGRLGEEPWTGLCLTSATPRLPPRTGLHRLRQITEWGGERSRGGEV